ncbi:MAG: class II aldolase/adducin family protein [Pseudomonadota bacterium]
MRTITPHPALQTMDHAETRRDLAACFRWTYKLDWHEGVANHFSVRTEGKKFLLNPDKMHFARIKASDLIEYDADDETTMEREDAPDHTAWGLHGAIHRLCPHVNCAIHLHTKYATTLASLADSTLPPVDQTSAAFFGRVAVDDGYSGLAFEEEGERVCSFLSDPGVKVLVMGNHGVMAVGENVSEAFDTAYYFERACETYITALSTGKPLRVLDGQVAAKVAQEAGGESTRDGTPSHAKHLQELRAILDEEGSDYAL